MTHYTEASMRPRVFPAEDFANRGTVDANLMLQ